MAENLFHCDTCDVHLTGPQPALQHYSGSKHRKKEAVRSINATAFSASVAGTTAGCSTPESASGLETQTCSLNLPSSESGRSDDWMKCGGNVSQSVPACSVVMVPPLNPALPPVPVTMTQNVLPQTDYEFHGSSGWCCLCSIQLSSQQDADQHLSGQKHLKAKKRWEARREQLRMTVSGFPPSMKSKPVAMCQPQRCEMPAKDSISDIIAKYNSSRADPPAIATATAAESADVVDGMQWFSCEVCKKKMNTVEMLQLHQRSPAHLRKVERQQMGVVPGDNTVWQSCTVCHKQLNSLTQLEIHMKSHSRPSHQSNYSSLACPEGGTMPPVATPSGVQSHHGDVCNKHMNTAAELERHRQSPAHQRKSALRDDPLTGNIGDNTVWQRCPVCAKRLNSVKQLDIHMNSHGPTARSLLGNASTGDVVDTVHAENQLTSAADTNRMLEALSVSSLLAAEKIDLLTEFADNSDVKNLTTGVDCLQLQGEGSSQDDAEMASASFMRSRNTDVSQLLQRRSDAEQLSGSSVDQTTSRAELTSGAAAAADGGESDDDAVGMLKNSMTLATADYRELSHDEAEQNAVSETSRQAEVNASAAVAAAAAAADDDDDDSVRMLKTLDGLELTNDETQQTSSENLVSEISRQTEINSLAAAVGDHDDDDDDDDAEKLITDDDLITWGCCASVGCVYHCELCDVHLNGDEPRSMHLTGSRHIACRQKAAEETASPTEDNPYSPQFRYCCALCSVPFNTLRDQRQHERGQQHLSKSVRLPAPQRHLPSVVLPTDEDYDSCMPDSPVTSKPRSYQEELYFKALVADCICFLPTGTDSSTLSHYRF